MTASCHWISAASVQQRHHPAALQLDPDVGMKTMNMLTRRTRNAASCKRISTTILENDANQVKVSLCHHILWFLEGKLFKSSYIQYFFIGFRWCSFPENLNGHRDPHILSFRDPETLMTWTDTDCQMCIMKYCPIVNNNWIVVWWIKRND